LDQGTHLINDVIKYLIDHFILKHTSVTRFIIRKEVDMLSLQIRILEPYSTNWLMRIEMIRTNTYPQFYSHIEPPTKLEQVKTSFQLVYGLHPLLAIEYLLPSKLGEHVNPTPLKVLTSQLS
jgi:hypothetical protein